jgi:hypothetical protein
MQGRSRTAYAEASAAREEVCADRWSRVECFGVHALLARTSPDEAERAQAQQAAAEVRAQVPEQDESMAELEQRYFGAAPRARAPR